MRVASLLLLFLIVFNTEAQQSATEWSKPELRKGQLIKLLPTSDPSVFYALRWTGSRMFGHYQVTRHDNFEIKGATKVRLAIEQSVCSFVNVDIINDKCVAFLSDIRDNQNHLYLRVFSDDLSRVEKEQKLASYEFEKGHFKGQFGIRFSQDRKYFSVVWEKEGKKNTEHIYGYRVFDKDLNVMHEGEYSLPYSAELSEIQGHYISNSGDYFIAVLEYDENEIKKGFRYIKAFKSLHIFHIDETGLLDYPVDLEGRNIYTLKMSYDSKDLVNLSGLYGDFDELGIKGVFYQKLDLSQEKVLDKGFCELKTDIITEGWSDRARKRLKKKEEKGKDDAVYFNYEMREASIQKDSSIIGSMEQHFVQERLTETQQSGLSSNTFYYYYNDIIVYRLNKKGEFDWIKKVRKYQVSTNDGGPYSGYVSYSDSSKMYMLFNDHVENYDSTGHFIEGDEVYITHYGKKKNVVALTSVDIVSGKIERTILHARRDRNFLFVPKLSYHDSQNRRVVLYGVVGRKEVFGQISY
ncbi:MAG: hypothetical protein EP333_03405 [Bacteroidetes bacterium]|nr:MAG: hypothetical protein EP333_03405 [Bacteroidota bacterium]TNE96835.1 MAG: hypothetical protein EP322_07725 [Bacteroidota bacterium]